MSEAPVTVITAVNSWEIAGDRAILSLDSHGAPVRLSLTHFGESDGGIDNRVFLQPGFGAAPNVEQSSIPLRGHKLAKAALAAKTNFRQINFGLLVLGNPRRRTHRFRRVANVLDLVDRLGLCNGNLHALLGMERKSSSAAAHLYESAKGDGENIVPFARTILGDAK